MNVVPPKWRADSAPCGVGSVEGKHLKSYVSSPESTEADVVVLRGIYDEQPHDRPNGPFWVGDLQHGDTGEAMLIVPW